MISAIKERKLGSRANVILNSLEKEEEQRDKLHYLFGGTLIDAFGSTMIQLLYFDTKPRSSRAYDTAFV